MGNDLPSALLRSFGEEKKMSLCLQQPADGRVLAPHQFYQDRKDI